MNTYPHPTRGTIIIKPHHDLIKEKYAEIHNLFSELYMLTNTRKYKKTKIRQDIRFLMEYCVNRYEEFEGKPFKNTINIEKI